MKVQNIGTFPINVRVYIRGRRPGKVVQLYSRSSLSMAPIYGPPNIVLPEEVVKVGWIVTRRKEKVSNQQRYRPYWIRFSADIWLQVWRFGDTPEKVPPYPTTK